MNRVTINGKTITSSGSISIINGKVYIDGKEQETGDEKVINISIEGNVEKLEAPGCGTITVSGNAGTVSTTSGDVEIGGDVHSGVSSTSGNIEVEGNVSGNLSSTSGNIKCKNVVGDVRTMSGNIKHN